MIHWLSEILKIYKINNVKANLHYAKKTASDFH